MYCLRIYMYLDWTQPDFDDSHWTQAAYLCDMIDCAPWGVRLPELIAFRSERVWEASNTQASGSIYCRWNIGRFSC